MKSFFFAAGLALSSVVAGCAFEPSAADGASTEASAAEVTTAASHVLAGNFKLYAEPFHRPSPGCDLHTSIELKQTPTGAVAIVEERVGGMCLVASIPNHREYELRQTTGACAKVYEGETIVKNGVGLDPHKKSKIKIEDNRGFVCMAKPFLGELVVTETLAKTAGPETTTKFSSEAEPVTLKGTLVHSVGIGGENTGTSLETADGMIELVLSPEQIKAFVEERVARVTGVHTVLQGVETGERDAIKVSALVVCPAPGSFINMMPHPFAPGQERDGVDNGWILENCPGVQGAF